MNNSPRSSICLSAQPRRRLASPPPSSAVAVGCCETPNPNADLSPLRPEQIWTDHNPPRALRRYVFSQQSNSGASMTDEIALFDRAMEQALHGETLTR